MIVAGTVVIVFPLASVVVTEMAVAAVVSVAMADVPAETTTVDVLRPSAEKIRIETICLVKS